MVGYRYYHSLVAPFCRLVYLGADQMAKSRKSDHFWHYLDPLDRRYGGQRLAGDN